MHDIDAPALAVELTGPRRWLGLREQARLIGSWVYVEQMIFASLGAAAADLGRRDAGWASSASRRAAWRADELGKLLPVSVGLPTADECVCAPGDSTEAALRLLSEVASPRKESADELPAGDTRGQELAARLLQIYDALLNSYAEQLKHIAPAADTPMRVILKRVHTDLSDAQEVLSGSFEHPGRTA